MKLDRMAFSIIFKIKRLYNVKVTQKPLKKQVAQTHKKNKNKTKNKSHISQKKSWTLSSVPTKVNINQLPWIQNMWPE